MFVDRDPIDRLAILTRPVSVSLVVLHVNALVKNLAKSNSDGLKNAEQPVKQWRSEVRIVDEVVRNAVDIP